jgi:CheY-like chemotaxis protein
MQPPTAAPAGSARKRTMMRILLIDDDPLDAQMVKRVLTKQASAHALEVAASADEALRALAPVRRADMSAAGAWHGGSSPSASFHASAAQTARSETAQWGAEGLPDLILLDLNMPGMSGQDFLTAVEANPHLADIPVVVLTTSGLPHDIKTCFDRGADGYFVKPLEYARFADLLTRIIDYWFLCETPQRSPEISP